MRDIRVAANALPPRVKRWGVDRPQLERRLLRAGPVTAVLEGGDIRYISAGREEIVRRLYMAVRDRNWDTIEAVFTRYELTDEGDAFVLELAAEHVNADVDFAWTGRLTGERDGTIRYEMNGQARRTFLRSRIGFCVLHPMDLAGTSATVSTPDGAVQRPFPNRISAHAPFEEMLSISHPVGSTGRCDIQFEGELFEMEDQRNWTDASYKTFSTPLRLPHPIPIEPGQPVIQSVTIRFYGVDRVDETSAGGPDVTILGPVGALPRIGLSAGTDGRALGAADIDQLRVLRLSHLWAAIDLTDASHAGRLQDALAQGGALGIPLHLEVSGVAGHTEGILREMLASCPDAIERVAVFPPAENPVVFPRHDLYTDRATIDVASRAAADTGVAIGGGSRAYFTEFNRGAGRLPFDRMAWATYSINPQVHAFDNGSLVETLAAQAVTVESARVIAGDVPLVIGPITLKPRFNPSATAPPPEPGPNKLPADVDPRQLSLFAAAWTVGSIGRLAIGTEALTYDQLTGPRGVIASDASTTFRAAFPSVPGQLYPLYHVFAAIADLRGGDVLGVGLADPLMLEALAVRHDRTIRVLVANLTPELVVARVHLPHSGTWRRSMLDEQSYGQAAADPAFLTASAGVDVESDGEEISLELLPYAVACLTQTTT